MPRSTRVASSAAALAACLLPLYLAVAGGRMGAPDLVAAMALADNPWWIARGWLTILYFPASLVAVLAVCWRLRERRPLLVLTAAAFFLMASTLDLAFRAQQLFVVFGAWGEMFTASTDSALRAAILREVELFLAAGTGWRIGFLMAFGIARLALAGALWRPGALHRLTAALWAITGALNLHTLLLLAGVRLGPSAGGLYLLPWGLSFLLLAVWLGRVPAGDETVQPGLGAPSQASP